jgi:hypothetical protein
MEQKSTVSPYRDAIHAPGIHMNRRTTNNYSLDKLDKICTKLTVQKLSELIARISHRPVKAGSILFSCDVKNKTSGNCTHAVLTKQGRLLEQNELRSYLVVKQTRDY